MEFRDGATGAIGGSADRRIGAQAHRQLKRLLESAVEVTVQRVETEKVVEILGDEVDLYLFELEGRRYFVGDKWTLHSPRQGRGAKWPNSCFELIRIPGSIEEFGPFCYGRKIEPFESLDFRDVDLDKLSGDSRLFHGSLDSLRLGSTEA